MAKKPTDETAEVGDLIETIHLNHDRAYGWYVWQEGGQNTYLSEDQAQRIINVFAEARFNWTNTRSH